MFGTATTVLGYPRAKTAIKWSALGDEHGQGYSSVADRHSDSRNSRALADFPLGSGRSKSRRPELVSGSIDQPVRPVSTGAWIRKRIQGDGAIYGRVSA
jgi:hypothetical protein